MVNPVTSCAMHGASPNIYIVFVIARPNCYPVEVETVEVLGLEVEDECCIPGLNAACNLRNVSVGEMTSVLKQDNVIMPPIRPRGEEGTGFDSGRGSTSEIGVVDSAEGGPGQGVASSARHSTVTRTRPRRFRGRRRCVIRITGILITL